MKRSLLLFTLLLLLMQTSRAQTTTAMDFSGLDCNGNTVRLFDDLDAGQAVVLFFYMANCASCPPEASKIQTMANHINANHPNTVKGYAFPFTNATTCTYSANWVNNNNLSLYAPMDSGSAMVNYYGGFGMPTVVLVGGSNHEVLFVTQSFSTGDTTTMRDEILTLISATGVKEPSNSSFTLFPNPAAETFSVDMDVQSPGITQITICDAMGRQVAELFKGTISSGPFSKTFSTAALPSGNYFLRLSTNGEAFTRKLNIQH